MKIFYAILACTSILIGASGCGSNEPAADAGAKKELPDVGGAPPGGETPPQDAFAANVAPMLAANCVGCHSGPQPKGGIDMTKFATEADAKANIATIHKMIEEVEEGHMPPPKVKVLPAEDRTKLLEGLKALG